MRIKSFHVQGLLGQFDHDIKFNTKERITIIHGPNGVGKTTVLRLMESVLDLRYSFLRSCIFNRLQIKFLAGGTLTLTKNTAKSTTKKDISIAIKYVKGPIKEEWSLTSSFDSDKRSRDFPLSMIDDVIPQLERIDARTWWDHSVGEPMDMEDIVERYGEMLPISIRPTKPPNWLDKLIGSISTRFIQTQRLQTRYISGKEYRHRRSRETMTSAVAEIAKDMSSRIQTKLRESGSLAASLDRTFPHRIIEGSLPKDATEANIRNEYEEQQEYRNRLMAAGLIDAEELVPLPKTALDESEKKVLWFYLEDVSKKMKVYSELLERAALFKSILDDKKFLNKSIKINGTNGIEFKSNSGNDVPIQSLSSGEQQEVVIAYELLFRSGKNQLVMIDEPELSLHVTWQQKFLDDITRISELANLDFIIATHSPSIVGHRTDLMVALHGE